MKTLTYFLILALAIGALSCESEGLDPNSNNGNSGTDGGNGNDTTTDLVYITDFTTQTEGIPVTTNHIYDDSRKLTDIVYRTYGHTYRQYTYDASERLIKLEEYDIDNLLSYTWDLSYADNRLESITRVRQSDGSTSVGTCAYLGNVVDYDVEFNNSGSSRRFKYIFRDENLNEIVREEEYYASFPDSLRRSIDYLYDGNGNMVAMNIAAVNQSNMQFEPTNELLFEYDSNPNPFENMNHIGLLSDLILNRQYVDLDLYLFLKKYAPNNVVSETWEIFSNGQFIEIGYDYIYDDEGYPVQRTRTMPGSPVTRKFNYVID